MTDKDVLFQEIQDNPDLDQTHFCHYGWEGTGTFAFWKFAKAYYDSAEALFEKFKQSKGDYAILDGIGVTMCFLYRHFVELSIKYLYLKYVCTSEDDFKDYLNINGHFLIELWNAAKPELRVLRERVGSTVSLGVLEHYIKEFNDFDRDSMTMRYPVNKKLEPTNKQTRLDIFNLHDRMQEMFYAFDGLDGDLENQLKQSVDQKEIDTFLLVYQELRPKVYWFLDSMKPFAESESDDITITDLMDFLKSEQKNNNTMVVFNKCSDDELIMFDTLYYTGRMISCEELRLPKNPDEARQDVITRCILNLKQDHLEFGKPKNDQINIYAKLPSSIIRFVSKTVSIIDRDR